MLLNEVHLLPAAGQPQWIELINAGGEIAALDGMALENHRRDRFALPGTLVLPPASVLLVRFDGQTGADASVIHAATGFLATAGFVRLTGPQGPLDRLAWGDGQDASANLSRGYQDDLTPGMSLGRVPGLVASDPLEWVPFSPQQATPGRPNPRPGVEILLPMDGAIVTTERLDLTWYTVAGAARYRVQLALDHSFESPLFDQTIAEPPLRTPALAPGSYLWRVQAIAPDGTMTTSNPPNGSLRERWRQAWRRPIRHSWRPCGCSSR